MSMNENTKTFPKGFLWGAATAGHQIEGGLEDDWSEWEESSKRVKELKDKGLNPEDFQAKIAADSWNRLEEDIACLKKLGATAYRFSVEWSRIEPEEGKFNEQALLKYHNFIKRLKEEGIEPFVTLWHWPVPLWVRDKGGWSNKKIVGYFKKYAEKVVQTFGEVDFWLTINEPQVYTSKGYLVGHWPPNKKSPLSYLRVLLNMAKVHNEVYGIIKSIKPKAKVSFAHHHVYFSSAKGDLISETIVKVADWLVNHWFMNKVIKQLDFISINHYFHNVINYWKISRKTEKEISDMDWGLYPKGLYESVKAWQKTSLPIYITEHGLADEKDRYRAWYIKESLTWLHKAIEEGVDIRGYLHWSLLDNFEWADGLNKKFGLFEIDRKTLERKPRASVSTYAEIIKNNGLF